MGADTRTAPDATTRTRATLDALAACLDAGCDPAVIGEAIAEAHAAAHWWEGTAPARCARYRHLARALEHLLDAHQALTRERTTRTRNDDSKGL